MKYTVCYAAGHTRVIEFAGMTWTPGELVEFSSPEEIPEAVIEDSRFAVVFDESAPSRRKKKQKATIVPEPQGDDPTEPGNPEG